MPRNLRPYISIQGGSSPNPIRRRLTKSWKLPQLSDGHSPTRTTCQQYRSCMSYANVKILMILNWRLLTRELRLGFTCVTKESPALLDRTKESHHNCVGRNSLLWRKDWLRCSKSKARQLAAQATKLNKNRKMTCDAYWIKLPCPFLPNRMFCGPGPLSSQEIKAN